jgi:hypothetical protein
MKSRLLFVLSWVLTGLALLVLLFGWPFTIWRAVDSGYPFGPAVLNSLLWPTAAIVIWAVARGCRIISDGAI